MLKNILRIILAVVGIFILAYAVLAILTAIFPIQNADAVAQNACDAGKYCADWNWNHTVCEDWDYKICHINPAQNVQHDYNQYNSCTNHLGTPHNNQTYDVGGTCPAPSPTPTPTLKPTPTPTPTPPPNEEPTHLACVELACVVVEGEGSNTCKLDADCLPEEPLEEPPVEEPPVVVKTIESKPEGCTQNCGVPACTDQTPEKAPANFHVYRNGDSAILRWVPDGSNPGDKVNIYYKQNTSADWQYSVQAPNSGYFEVTGLDSMDITFAIQQVNGCAAGNLTGPITEPVVDGPTSSWILFK